MTALAYVRPIPTSLRAARRGGTERVRAVTRFGSGPGLPWTVQVGAAAGSSYGPPFPQPSERISGNQG